MQMIKRNSRDGKFKRDALKLTEGPHLAGYVIQHSDTYRLLIIDGAIMRFTPTEYALLLRLLKHSERHLAFAVLEQCLFLRSLNGNPRSALIRHMRRIRPKLWPFGLDILSITGYGYTLHATRQELATVQTLETVNLPA
jgi:DNA-binding response OmpR family regulator